MAEHRWMDQSYNAEALVDADGKIIGVIRGGWRDYSAYSDSGYAANKIGDYIDRESAKRAVEKAIARAAHVGDSK